MTLTTEDPGRAAPPASAKPPRATHKIRKDIQALRAFAVLSVVLYHLWPTRLTGGFVGVDVFFVISGFLISAHLISAPPRRPVDFLRFWGRRILRLLPAVVVVILATLGAVVVYVPRSLWQSMAHDAFASMFYSENWRLISLQTSYLNAQTAPSPYQHFWSLSVEEQFYIGWPFIVALIAFATVGRSRARTAAIFAAGFGAVALASLIWSIILTRTSPAQAYFSTFTRVWELGIGGVLAGLYMLTESAWRRFVTARLALFWAGVAAMVASLFVIKAATPFPGWAALLPTVGAAAVILAGNPSHAGNPRWLFESPPVQFIGNSSYAMYLWHWPIIVLVPYALNHDLTRKDKILALALSFVVAGASTALLEGPIRNTSKLKGHTGRIIVLGAVCSLIVSCASFALLHRVEGAQNIAAKQVNRALSSKQACFGAGALDPKNHCPANPQLVTTPEFAKTDRPDGITQCMNWPKFETSPVVCRRGNLTNPSARIALFGNSHAAQWLPAFEQLAGPGNWQVDSYVVGLCNPIFAPQGPWPAGFNGIPGDQLPGTCTAFVHKMVALIIGKHYNLVVIAARDPGLAHEPSYRLLISQLQQAGEKVAVIRDTPASMNTLNQTPDCVARNLDNTAACDGDPARWIPQDPIAAAAGTLRVPSVPVWNLNGFICRAHRCPAVVGGVIVYFDFNHLSATYVKTLAPYLEPLVVSALR